MQFLIDQYTLNRVLEHLEEWEAVDAAAAELASMLRDLKPLREVAA